MKPTCNRDGGVCLALVLIPLCATNLFGVARTRTAHSADSSTKQRAELDIDVLHGSGRIPGKPSLEGRSQSTHPDPPTIPRETIGLIPPRRVAASLPPLPVEMNARYSRPGASRGDPIRLIVVVPSDGAAVQRVFGTDIPAAMAAEVRRLSGMFEDQGTVLKNDDGIKELEDAIASAGDRRVIIVGHSEQKGQLLKLPDGTTVSIDQLPPVLTCWGRDFAIDGPLRMDDALAICREWRSKADVLKSLDDYVSSARRVIASQKSIRNVRCIVIGAGGGLVVFVLADDGQPTTRPGSEGLDR